MPPLKLPIRKVEIMAAVMLQNEAGAPTFGATPVGSRLHHAARQNTGGQRGGTKTISFSIVTTVSDTLARRPSPPCPNDPMLKHDTECHV